MRRLKIALAFSVCMVPGMIGQTVDSPTFEVVSVKPYPAQPAVVSPMTVLPGGRLSAPTTTVAQLIGFAYRVQDYQLGTDVPWVRSRWFAVTATARDDASSGVVTAETYERVSLMVRGLLADRFKLRVHSEVRSVPTYALTLARSDAVLGPKMSASTEECERVGTAGRGADTTASTSPPTRRRCGLQVFARRLVGVSVPARRLANILSDRLGRPVIDETGLQGAFDYELTWTPDEALDRDAAGSLGQNGQGSATQAIPSSGPSLVTALQEQLGLRLLSTRAPVEVLVVDQVEQPDAD